TRGQAASYRGRQKEARLVEEDDVGLASVRLAEDAWQLIVQPPLHLLIVLFAGLALGLLAGPAQALLEDLADMLGVQGDAHAFADQACDAVGGPELVGPGVSFAARLTEAFRLRPVVLG